MLQARYMLLLMGIFATFCGFIYNDMMAIPLETFGSCFDSKSKKWIQDCTHPVGLDPVWYLS
jgi:V-type H+-transporting ATPase subunit a